MRSDPRARLRKLSHRYGRKKLERALAWALWAHTMTHHRMVAMPVEEWPKEILDKLVPEARKP